jgi:hypothetical protein
VALIHSCLRTASPRASAVRAAPASSSIARVVSGAWFPPGELALDWSTLTDTADPDQQLIALTAAPGTPAHDGLRLLASWAAEPATARRSAGDALDHPRTP